MISHGTALRVTPSIAREFHSALIVQLPDLTDEEMRRYIRDKSGLGHLFRKALMPNGKQPAGNAYPLSVNYGRSVEDGVKAGRYDWADLDITSRNFQTKRTGTADIMVELIHFNRSVLTDDALIGLVRADYRPNELHELLAFGEKYPDVQREFPIVALGSVWHDRYGRRNFPYLYREGSRRDLTLGWLEDDWNHACRFAAVRE